MTRDTHDLSIKTIIITTFVLVIIVAAVVIAYLIFSRWYSSAESTVMKISHSINNHIYEQVASFMERTAYLHDIGKIVLDPHILDCEHLRDDEREQMRQHPAIGYRILNLFDDTLDIAEYVYGHHERWDGSGYPRGLKHDQIPYISRILSIAEAYERIMERSHSRDEAIKEIREGKGTQFDPELAYAFLDMIEQ